MTMIATFCVVFASFLIGIYVYFKDTYRYWKRRGVRYLEPSFPFGNFRDGVTAMSSGEVMRNLYEKAKGEQFFGFWLLHRPVLMVRSPELIKQILVKDFSHFCDRAVHVDEKMDPLSGHLFALKGEKWKFIRAKMTPTFTTGKMKMMFPIVSELSRKLVAHLEEINDGATEIEMGEIHARFTTDVISACAFGIRTNSIAETESDFRKIGRKIFEPSFASSLRTLVLFMLPKLAEALKLRIIPKEVSSFFMDAVKDMIRYREDTGVTGRDFMQLLIQLKNGGAANGEQHRYSDGCISVEQAAAQAFVFFLAGFETSSTTMTYAVYELAKDQELQQRLRVEIEDTIAKCGGEITYEAVQEMLLLDKVLCETLRKYPPISALNRECTKNYEIPGTEIVIEKGTLLVVSVLGLHRDEKYYPDPDVFDPERFAEGAKAGRHRFAYLPFGEGPRVCIGLRFGVMQAKVGLITLLAGFNLRLSPRTTVPLKFDPNSIVMTPKGGLWIQLESRMGDHANGARTR